MTYRMFVSRDLGLNYRIVERDLPSPNIEYEMRDKLEEYEKDHVRWVIEDENGRIVNYCKVFREQLDILKASYVEGSPILFVTDDIKLRHLLNALQDELMIAMATIADDLHKENIDAEV